MPNIDKKISPERLEEIVTNLEDTYIYLKIHAKFYWCEKRKFFSQSELALNIRANSKEINELRDKNIIKTYDDFCYIKGGKKGYFNLLDEDSILKLSNNPVIHKDIKNLITSVAGGKNENINYLLKSILYKYTHINDFTLPAIVFYGVGGSGKGTFISLLGTIFGEENILANLGQRDLNSNFDTYTGKKLVVEFAELSTNNTNSDYKILNKLKNIVLAEKIIINEKGVKQYQTNNIAWFFISSNSNKPLQLDDRDKGNRRFSIMHSSLKLENGEQINQTIKDKKIVSDFLAWLHQKFPEVIKYKNFKALDNEDKRELEESMQSEANSFWEWFEEKFPKEKKVTIEKIDNEMYTFCIASGINYFQFKKYFWNYSKYLKKKIRIGNKTYYGVKIT